MMKTPEITTPGYKVCGTGPRAIETWPVRARQDLRTVIVNKLDGLRIDHDDLVVVSGMAEGFDAMLASVATEMDIPFVACVPNPSYGSYYWGQKSQTGTNRLDEYLSLIELATEVVFCSQTIYCYPDGKRIHSNFYRNEVMVDNSDQVLAYYTDSGGTIHCIRYAEDNRIPVIRVK